MQVTPELINRFFENKCSDIEVKQVILYFAENKEELDKYIGKTEWDLISTTESIEWEITESILAKVKKALFQKQTAKILSLKGKWLRWTAAASVVILAGLSFLFEKTFREHTHDQTAQANTRPLQKKIPGKEPAILWQLVANQTKASEKILLEDGSIVTLYKGSSIGYSKPFQANKREIFLKGDAFFEVAKNRARPFTVYSGALSTTALGTSFRVTAFDKQKKNIQIRLFTGKVVVKSTEKLGNWLKDIILNPGEEISYKGENTVVAVSKFTNPEKVTISQNQLSAKNEVHSNDLAFHNASLIEVIKAIESMFNIKIQYTKQQVEKMNFTGSINRSDEVKTILKVITQMNGLDITESADGFTIIKPN